MRPRCLLLSAVLVPAGLVAQTLGFDLGVFPSPPGWEVTRGSGRITFTTKDGAVGTYVMLSIYDSAPSSGHPESNFRSEWQAVVASAFHTGGPPRSTPGRTRGGLDFREAVAPVSWSQGPATVHLRTFTVGDRTFSVLAVATDTKALGLKAAAIQGVLDGVRLTPRSTGGSMPAAVLPKGVPAGRGDVPATDKGIAGVWMTFRAYPPNMEPRPRYYVFWEDGQVMEDLPREGLADFSRASSQADAFQRPYWGTYTLQGGTGTIRRPEAKYLEKLNVPSAMKLQVDSDVFQRVRSVDGLRLQGSWTSYANPQDPALLQLPQGRRPVFHFTRAGRFTDEGVLAVFLTSGDPAADRAGAGTYELRDHSLILHFDDGRTRAIAFTGLLSADPSQQQDILIIGRSPFRKRS